MCFVSFPLSFALALRCLQIIENHSHIVACTAAWHPMVPSPAMKEAVDLTKSHLKMAKLWAGDVRKDPARLKELTPLQALVRACMFVHDKRRLSGLPDLSPPLAATRGRPRDWGLLPVRVCRRGSLRCTWRARGCLCDSWVYLLLRGVGLCVLDVRAVGLRLRARDRSETTQCARCSLVLACLCADFCRGLIWALITFSQGRSGRRSSRKRTAPCSPNGTLRGRGSLSPWDPPRRRVGRKLRRRRRPSHVPLLPRSTNEPRDAASL